jgi:hypothetical protein
MPMHTLSHRSVVLIVRKFKEAEMKVSITIKADRCLFLVEY